MRIRGENTSSSLYICHLWRSKYRWYHTYVIAIFWNQTMQNCSFFFIQSTFLFKSGKWNVHFWHFLCCDILNCNQWFVHLFSLPHLWKKCIHAWYNFMFPCLIPSQSIFQFPPTTHISSVSCGMKLISTSSLSSIRILEVLQ